MSNRVPAYVTAYEHFNEHRNTLKMTTGSANLDSLIDSIQEGQFYLFYGSNKAVLDGLVYGLLVNCVLPKQKHGFESMVLYILFVYSQFLCLLYSTISNSLHDDPRKLKIISNKRSNELISKRGRSNKRD